MTTGDPEDMECRDPAGERFSGVPQRPDVAPPVVGPLVSGPGGFRTLAPKLSHKLLGTGGKLYWFSVGTEG